MVRAGLLPALRAGAVPGSERWFVADDGCPAPDPFEELEAALRRVAAAPRAAGPGRAARARRGALRDAVAALLPGDDAELLLVIDQFEELFTLAPTRTARRVPRRPGARR